MNDAIKILKMALEAEERSLELFINYKNEVSEGEFDTANAFWAQSCEYTGKTHAYLDCYRLLTGKRVYGNIMAIKEELQS